MTIENTYADVNLSIHLGNLLENYNLLRSHAQGAECFPVVKANAYGLGLKKIAPILAKAGCHTMCVATVDEAITLRHLIPDISIIVFNGVNKHNKETFRVYNLIPCINSFEQFCLFNEYGIEKASQLPAFLHVDTGMNRLGFSKEELESNIKALRQAEGVKWLYLMSHLACADLHEHPLTNQQLERFQQCRKFFPYIKGSIANSSGVFLGRDYLFHAIRPGAALYGINPTPNMPNPMKPVVSLKGKIIQLRTLSQPETVGYRASYQAEAGTKLAVVPIGYGDGYLRSLSNRLNIVSIAGHPAPIAGIISMDSMILDVTEIPEKHLSLGAEVELLGDTIHLDEIAAAAGTIPYEILTNLGSRFRREYTNSPAPQENILTRA